MLGLIIPLVTVLTYGLAANVDECSFGESYWCSSLENAKTCGALGHCKTTVWQKEILKQDESEICVFCETIIKNLENYVRQSETEQGMVGFLTKTFQMIPSKRRASKSHLLVRNYLPDIIDLVKSDVKPRVTCSLLKLCVGYEDTVSHPHLPVSPVKPQLITKLFPLPIQSETVCTDCLKFFTDIRNILQNNVTEKEIETFIDQTICTLFGGCVQTCTELVKYFLPDIIQLMTSECGPKVICYTVGFCDQTLSDSKSFLLNLKLKNSDFYSFASAETEMKNFLKKEVCEYFGDYKSACKRMIDVHGEAVFKSLASELDLESRGHSLERVAETPLCDLCKSVLGKIDGFLNQTTTKRTIIAALLKICSFLPFTIRTQCDAAVQLYGNPIIDLLIKELDPNVFCFEFKLCLAASKESLQPKFKVDPGFSTG